MTAKRLELRELLSVKKDYVAILVPLDELVLAVPEFACLGGTRDTSSDISKGGYFFSISRIGYDTLAAEVGMKANHYDVLVHEFAHSIHFRITTNDSRYKHLGDPTFQNRLEAAYQQGDCVRTLERSLRGNEPC